MQFSTVIADLLTVYIFVLYLSVQIVSVIFSRARRENVLLVFFLLTNKRFSRNNAVLWNSWTEKMHAKCINDTAIVYVFCRQR